MVLDNIINNASKYSPNGKDILVILTRDKEHVSIAVKDRGFGLTKQDQKKLFHKFSRIKSVNSKATEGSGLGLYWSKKIVDMHGGVIEVESSKDEGTTFTVRLPKKP
jgi:signal transduction histidine kinase